MRQTITFVENNISLAIEVTADGDVRLMHLSPLPWQGGVDEPQARWARLVELQMTGENQLDHHGSKYTATSPARLLKYQAHRDVRTAIGRKLEIDQAHDGVQVTSHLQFYDNLPVIRSWTTVTNAGNSDRFLEYVTSFALTGISRGGARPRDETSRVLIPHNTWHGEGQWRRYTLPELGMAEVQSYGGSWTLKRISCANTGTWSSDGLLPMGCYENLETKTAITWQIEHNGSWHWEISTAWSELYLQLSGPTFNENHWMKRLQPGERFESVPVAVALVVGEFQEAVQALTRYRRRIRRPNRDNETLPVIFNDYMNCLFGDPTTEKLLPLIDAARDVGCEMFCIDAGWYADNSNWWDDVGEWLPSRKRFPEGLPAVLQRIRDAGMIPGLWLEIESMGIQNRLAKELPDNFFFNRNGIRHVQHSRHQLDFRNPAVRSHADAIIRRVVEEYGVGYIKMDYNINAGPGTSLGSDSLGDGLLEHNRAYLDWVDQIFARYPDLTIENCGSGGLRMDYAMLARHSIQSTSDQTDYRKAAVIAASSFCAVTPEQAAFWSYPIVTADEEQTRFNMVNALLGRVHQSGHLAQIGDGPRACVKEGIAYYKRIRDDIRHAVPIQPLGLPTFADQWLASGLICEQKTYLAVWRREGSAEVEIPLPHLKGKTINVQPGYPAQSDAMVKWEQARGVLKVALPNMLTARLLELHY